MSSQTSHQNELMLYCELNNLLPPCYYLDYDKNERWLCEVVIGGTSFNVVRPADGVGDAKEQAAGVALKALIPVARTLPSAVSSTALASPSTSTFVRPTPSDVATSTKGQKRSGPILAGREEKITKLSSYANGEDGKFTCQDEHRFIEPTVVTELPVVRHSHPKVLHLEPENVCNLHAFCDTRGWIPEYQYVGDSPFAVTLRIPTIGIFTVGRIFQSKRSAKAHICWEALQFIERWLPNPPTRRTGSSRTSRDAQNFPSKMLYAPSITSSDRGNLNTGNEKTSIVWFHEFCQKNGWEKPDYYCSGHTFGTETYWSGFVTFYDKKYSVDHMSSKSIVKNELAKLIIEDLTLGSTSHEVTYNPYPYSPERSYAYAPNDIRDREDGKYSSQEGSMVIKTEPHYNNNQHQEPTLTYNPYFYLSERSYAYAPNDTRDREEGVFASQEQSMMNKTEPGSEPIYYNNNNQHQMIEPTIAPEVSVVRHSHPQMLHLEPENVSNLHSICDARGWNLDFQYVGDGPFAARLTIPAIGVFTVGRIFQSKQSAKAHMSWEALQFINKEQSNSAESSTLSLPARSMSTCSGVQPLIASSERSNPNTGNEKSPIVLFHEYCQQRHWKTPNYQYSDRTIGTKTYWAGSLTFQGREYSVDYLSSKSVVKHELAKIAAEDLGIRPKPHVLKRNPSPYSPNRPYYAYPPNGTRTSRYRR